MVRLVQDSFVGHEMLTSNIVALNQYVINGSAMLGVLFVFFQRQ